jgi:hypothetical protein
MVYHYRPLRPPFLPTRKTIILDPFTPPPRHLFDTRQPPTTLVATVPASVPSPRRAHHASCPTRQLTLLPAVLQPTLPSCSHPPRPALPSCSSATRCCLRRRHLPHAFVLAAQTLPALQTPHAHYPRSFQLRPTPPYNPPHRPYLDPSPSLRQPAFPETDHPWLGHRGQRGSEEQVSMSRPPTAATPATLADDGSRRPPDMASPMPPQPRAPMHPQQRQGPHASPSNAPFSLPPLRQLSSTPPTPFSDRRPGNHLGVQAMLNPQAELAEQQRNRQRSNSQLQTPSPIESQHSQGLPTISRPTSVDSTQDESRIARPLQPPGRPPPRHMANPRSPALHRTPTVTVLNAPTGTIDAHQSPFLTQSSRPISHDPVLPQPALPTPPVGSRTSCFPAALPTAPTPPPNMFRNELRRQSTSFPQSGSASPITNYSPYSQPASVASSQYETPGQQGSYMTAPHNPQAQDPHQPRLTMETERNRVSTTPTGQSSIQIMTIKSQQGHHVQIPVDVQAASKVADEKRKRNAGASARFRARRKEKEREASMSISRLETQLRDAYEDAEYYKNERDYFKSIVFQQPGAERHYARPPSPRLRRLSVAPSIAPSSTTGGGSADSPYSAYDDEPQEPERNVRRRTNTYHPTPEMLPTPSNGLSMSPSGYPSSGFHSVNGPPPSVNMPVNHPQAQAFDPRDQRPLPELHQRPILRDPFTPSVSGHHENRTWTPAPGQGRET